MKDLTLCLVMTLCLVIRDIAEAKGLPKRVGEKQAEEFFGEIQGIEVI